MKNIIKDPDGTFTFVIHLKEDERKRLKKLAKCLGMNDFETIKHCIRLVSWWSRNEIEKDE